MGTGAMETGWYALKRGAATGRQAGPFSWAELYAQAATGALVADDLVWNPQLPGWTKAAEIPGLSAAAAPAARATGRAASPPPLPDWARVPSSPPQAGQPGSKTPPPLPVWALSAVRPAARRRPSWLLPVLVPVVAVILAGAGLGAYFGAFYGKDGATGAGTQATTAPSATTQQGSGKIQSSPPDPSSVVQTQDGVALFPGQVLVMMAEGKSRADAEGVAQTIGGTVVGEVEDLNLYQIQTSGKTEADARAAVDKAAAAPGVETAFPNEALGSAEEIWGKRVDPFDDPAYAGDLGKGNALIGLPKALRYIKGSGLPKSPVNVGVADDGLWKNQGEFGNNLKIFGENSSFWPGTRAEPRYYRNESIGPGWVADPAGSHGTETAGIMVADPANGGQSGIITAAGVDVTLTPINLKSGLVQGFDGPTRFDRTDYSGIGDVNCFGMIGGLMMEVNAGATVINVSYGTVETSDSALRRESATAFRRFFEWMSRAHPDVIFVCAAMNANSAITPTNNYPAGAGSGLPNVITVGNVMNDTSRADSSNYAGEGGEITLSAPGEEAVRGTDAQGKPITDTYQYLGADYGGGGTSMAAPQVTSTVAILRAFDPDLSGERIKEILTQTARAGVLAIDEAVFQVISDARKSKGLPTLTREQLEAMGGIDAVATTTDKPNVYSVRGILPMASDNGTDVGIKGSEGVSVSGSATQHIVDASDEASWPTVTVTGPKATVTVTRNDSGASSVISFPASVWELSVEITRHDDTENRRVYTINWKAEITADADGNLSGSGKGSWHGVGVTRAADQITEDGTLTADAPLTCAIGGTVQTTAQGRILTIVPTLGDYTIENLVINSPSPHDEIAASFKKHLATWLSDGFAEFNLTAASDKPLSATITCGKYTGTATLTPLR